MLSPDLLSVLMRGIGARSQGWGPEFDAAPPAAGPDFGAVFGREAAGGEAATGGEQGEAAPEAPATEDPEAGADVPVSEVDLPADALAAPAPGGAPETAPFALRAGAEAPPTRASVEGSDDTAHEPASTGAGATVATVEERAPGDQPAGDAAEQAAGPASARVADRPQPAEAMRDPAEAAALAAGETAARPPLDDVPAERSREAGPRDDRATLSSPAGGSIATPPQPGAPADLSGDDPARARPETEGAAEAAPATPATRPDGAASAPSAQGAPAPAPQPVPLQQPSPLTAPGIPADEPEAGGDWRLAPLVEGASRGAGPSSQMPAGVVAPGIPGSLTRQLQPAPGRTAGDRIEIRLDPPELGKVQIEMRIVEGSLHALLLAERPEAGDLMRRHADWLQRELEAAGYGTVTLDFATGREDGAGLGTAQAPGGFQAADAEPAPPSPPAPPPSRPVAGGRLDIRL